MLAVQASVTGVGTVCWQVAPGLAVRQRVWDGESVVYALHTGEIHRLDALCTSLLATLRYSADAATAAIWARRLLQDEAPRATPESRDEPGVDLDLDADELTAVEVALASLQQAGLVCTVDDERRF